MNVDPIVAWGLAMLAILAVVAFAVWVNEHNTNQEEQHDE